MGDLDRGRQRPWNTRSRDDGDHAQPGAQLPGPPDPPAALLGHVNRQLSNLYTTANEVFVTAFYGVYDPARRTLTYSSAGHNPPRLRRCSGGSVQSLEEIGGPPLGLFEELEYEQTTLELRPYDVIAFYTDGITEAMDFTNAQFGVNRLDHELGRCDSSATAIVRDVIASVDQFTGGQPPEDDRTLLVARVS